ncbi:MAG: hypothetical protein QNJ81_14650 [Acidimicrobiia bacterium]|nr:hypothetical protein [Acidimicrobiia bacterium]
MLELLIALTDSDQILPDGTAERVVWLVIGAVILALYFLMKSARKKATREYWERREAEEDRIANDPDMRKD